MKLTKANSFEHVGETFYIAKKLANGKPAKNYIVYRVRDMLQIVAGADKHATIEFVKSKYKEHHKCHVNQKKAQSQEERVKNDQV